jgi:hypothetical protein
MDTDWMNQSMKTRIAHLAGPTATIQNTPPLVTSNKARAKHGLPLLKDADGAATTRRTASTAPRGASEDLRRAVLRTMAAALLTLQV